MSAFGNEPATDLCSSEVGTDGVLSKDSFKSRLFKV